MLSLRLNNKWTKPGLILLGTSFISLWVNAQIDCGEEICLSLPAITAGNVIDEQYFNGEISIQSSYEELLGVDKTASYSLDGGINWQEINLKHSFVPDLPREFQFPSAAILSDGNIVVSFQINHEVYAQRFTPNGLALSDKIHVSSPTLYTTFFDIINGEHVPYQSTGFSRVTAQANGGFIVSWQERKYKSFTNSLVSKRYNNQDEQIGEPIWLSRGIFGGGLATAFHNTTQLANGDIIIIWVDFEHPNPSTVDNGAYTNVRFAKVTSGGTVVGGDFEKTIANTYLDGMQTNPQVAALEDGGFVIAWQSYDQDNTGWGIYSQRFDANIQPVGSESRINIDNNLNSSYQFLNIGGSAFPSVTTLAGGGYAIAWEQTTRFFIYNVTQNYVQIYNSNGSRIGLPFPVQEVTPSTDSLPDNNQYRPIIYGLSNDEIVVTWRSRQEYNGLVFKKFKLDGSAIDTEPVNPEITPSIIIENWFKNMIIPEEYFRSTPTGNIWPYIDDGFVYTDNFENIVSVPGTKQLTANNLLPNSDIDIQFKVEDSTTGETWYSPIRSYIYADQNDGHLGSITYKNGYSKQTSETVSIDMNCDICLDLQLYERSAALSNDNCEAFGEWLPYGATSTLNTEVVVAIENAHCYQYKATATNILGHSFDYTSANILKVDQTAPVITVNSEALILDQLALDIQVSDVTTGLSSNEYTLNDAVTSTFSNGTLNVSVQNGVNRLIFTAIDKAGNATSYNYFVTADLTPPEIVIHSIEDGGVYGNDISLVYALTQELTNLVTLVDGVPRSDLVGLADGTHTLTIQGLDASGNPVSKTVTFTIDSTIFSLSLLSPQSRLYENNSITIEYAASKAVKRSWYKLNGGADMTDMALTNLADGNYSLVVYAESDTGATTSVNANFSVKSGIPTLQVLTPEVGRTFSDNQIKVTFASNSQISYKLGMQTGILSSGDNLVVPEDGNYTLVLSATHPVSGNVVTEAIPFSVDTLPLEVILQSPQAILYAHNNVSIDYSANKPLTQLSLTLDGEEVTTLSGLSSGQHNFHLRAEDSAGHQIEKQVQFTVTSLDIITPQDGTVVISNTAPPVLPFEYSAAPELSTLAYALDQGPKQLLTDSAGAVIPLTMPPGQHELRLQGSLNEFKVGKRSQFEIGAKNISVGPGSIDYNYDNCDVEGIFCDLQVTLKVSNTGDLDIFEPILIRFNHITDTGFQTQEQIVSGLAMNTDASLVLLPIRARIGDTLMLTVDPLAELNAEWLGDNLYQIQFETGQITEALPGQSLDNTYLEGVSVFNTFAVSTAGPVASVEVQMNGWNFVDNNATDGFLVLADMGLLSIENNCIHVIAKSNAQVVLDSTSLCANVKKLALQDITPLQFPWDAFTSAQNTVVTSTLDTAAVAVALAEARLYALKQPASVFATVDENAQLIYQLLADPAAVQDQPYSKTVDMGSAPIVGGNKSLPNGHGIFISTLDLSQKTCSLDGGIPIMTRPLSGDFENMFDEELANINSLANLGAFDDLIMDERAQFNSLHMSSLGLPIYALYARQELETENPWEVTGGLDDPSIGDLFIADLKILLYMLDEVFDFGFTFIGFINSTIPEQVAYVDIFGGYRYGFNSDGCLMTDGNYNNSVSLSFVGDLSARIRMISGLNISGGEIDLLGVAFLDSYGIPFLQTATFTIGGATLYTQNMYIPLFLDIGVDIAVVDQQLYFGPAYASFSTTVNHSGLLANADFAAYPVFLAGFGIGQDIKVEIILRGIGKANAGIGNHRDPKEPDSYEFKYVDFYGNITVYTRKKYCFLGKCHNKDWKKDSTPYDKTIKTDPESKYTDLDVERALKQLEGFDLGGLNDLTSMSLYATIIGDSQLATEYLNCAVYQNITENMPNVPIYSDRTGQCLLVTDPDYKPIGSANYYSDTSCSLPMSYTPTPFLEFCRNNLLEGNRLYTGNSAAWPDSGVDSSSGIKSTEWTLAHGPTIDVLAVSPQGNYRPFMKQAEYRVIDGCHLEMRIFKKDAQADNLKPMMFIHGGAWKYRGLGAIGMEAMVSQFTERGYVVFAPYYRLMGTSVGPAECHIPPGTDNVSPGEKIVVDIEAALDWVKNNGAVFGATPNSQVTLAGQSAGAHLSGWLSTHRSSDIKKALLFYPPTDMNYLIQEGQSGGIYGTSFDGGKSLGAEFLNYDAFSDINPNNLSPFVYENSYPNLINQGIDHPPTFMIHGSSDSLVPIEMSTRQCDALAGAPYGSTSTSGGLYNCGTQRGKNSRLHIIEGADHILDLKCFMDPLILETLGNPEAGNKVCPAGSLANEAYVKLAIEEALTWLQ